MTHIVKGAFYLLVAHDPISMKQLTPTKYEIKKKNKYFTRKFVTTDSNSARSRNYIFFHNKISKISKRHTDELEFSLK